jgi:hypothetical protein
MTTPILEPRSTVHVKELQGKSRDLDVIPVAPEQGRYHVSSASFNGAYYAVTLSEDGLGGSCTCPWGHYGGENCKHVLAALRAHYASEGQLSFWPSLSAARRQHRRLVRGERLYGTLRRD